MREAVTRALRAGTVERRPTASEIKAQWLAAHGVEVLRDLQEQIDQIQGLPNPDTRSRQLFAKLDHLLKGATP